MPSRFADHVKPTEAVLSLPRSVKHSALPDVQLRLRTPTRCSRRTVRTQAEACNGAPAPKPVRNGLTRIATQLALTLLVVVGIAGGFFSSWPQPIIKNTISFPAIPRAPRAELARVPVARAELVSVPVSRAELVRLPAPRAHLLRLPVFEFGSKRPYLKYYFQHWQA
jgi:hypothetical protein